MNKLSFIIAIAYCFCFFSCSKIKVDENRVNLVEIKQWCPTLIVDDFTLRINGEAQYCFAKSKGIDDCLFMQLDARSSDERGGYYFFLIGIDNDNIPFQNGSTPSLKKLHNTPAKIELINAFYGAEDAIFDTLGDVERCSLTYIRDGIVSVKIEGKETYFFKIDSFIPNNIDWALRNYLL